MSFYPLVKLRRASSNSHLNGADFTCEVEVTRELVSVLDKCDYLRAINNQDVDTSIPINFLNYLGQNVKLTYRLPRKSISQFYDSLDSFLDKYSSSFPTEETALPEFYLFNEDLYYSPKSNESDSSRLFDRLIKLIKYILKLETIAHYHDRKNGTDRTLVFLPGEQKNPIILLVHFSKELLKADINFSLLEELTAKGCQQNKHYSEKINIFYASLHEYLNSCNSPNESFVKLITTWSAFATLFRNNIKTYLSGFSFQKAKSEIAEAELELSEKLTNLTSDIVFKLFSVPASIIAIAAILQKGSFDLFVICMLLIGVIVTILLMYGLLVSQQNKYESLVKVKDLMLNSIDGKDIEYPEDLQNEITQMKERLVEHFRSTEKWLSLFKFAIFSPLGAMALFVISA